MSLMLKFRALKVIIGCVLLFFGLSIYLSNFYDFDILFVWWLILFSLLPLVFLSFNIDYIYIRIICVLTLVTQSISAPVFYIYKDDFYWDKPFTFNFSGAYEIFLKVFLFNFYLVLFSYLFRMFFKYSGSNKNYRITDWNNGAASRILFSNLRLPVNNNLSGIGLIFFLLLLIPINFWMFSQGIGVVGVQPSPLPFKLVGILFYFTKYIAPLLIFSLFYSSKRGLILVVFLMIYSFVLGLSSLSRFSFLIVLLPVIFVGLCERRSILLFVCGIIISFGFFFITYTRDFVYIISDGVVSGNFEDGLWIIVSNSISSLFSGNIDIKYFLIIPLDIINRVESFQNLVMAQFYDIYMLTTPLAIIANSFSINFFQIDPDLHHIQWQGNILPSGFFNGGGLLSNAVILGGANLAWILIYAFVVNFILFSFEILAFRLTFKYKSPRSIGVLLTAFFSFCYFAAGAGNNFILSMYAVVFLLSALPPFFSFNK